VTTDLQSAFNRLVGDFKEMVAERDALKVENAALIARIEHAEHILAVVAPVVRLLALTISAEEPDDRVMLLADGVALTHGQIRRAVNELEQNKRDA
jgi:hypothetical protein